MENMTDKRPKSRSPQDSVENKGKFNQTLKKDSSYYGIKGPTIIINAKEASTSSHYNNSKNLTPNKVIKYSNEHQKTPVNSSRVNCGSKSPYLPYYYKKLDKRNLSPNKTFIEANILCDNINSNTQNSNLATFPNYKIHHNPSKKRESNMVGLNHNFTNKTESLIKDIYSKIANLEYSFNEKISRIMDYIEKKDINFKNTNFNPKTKNNIYENTEGVKPHKKISNKQNNHNLIKNEEPNIEKKNTEMKEIPKIKKENQDIINKNQIIKKMNTNIPQNIQKNNPSQKLKNETKENNNEINILRENLEKLKKKIEILKKENENKNLKVQKENEKLKKEYESLEKENEKLKKENENLIKENENLNEKEKNFKNTIFDYDKKNRELKNEIEKLKICLKSSNTELNLNSINSGLPSESNRNSLYTKLDLSNISSGKLQNNYDEILNNLNNNQDNKK